MRVAALQAMMAMSARSRACHRSPMQRLLLLAAAALVAGCATSPRPGGILERPGKPAEPAVAPMLAQEQRWLGQWFDGTPVIIAPGEDGALEVDVPLEFSFDAGKSAVKAPLAAVLDKVSESLHRLGTARVQVAAPAGGERAALAGERASRLREYLLAKGVQSRRIEAMTVAGATAVGLRLVPPPAGVQRLEDAPPAAGRRITPRPSR
jgi:type IV pilus biogenesis protein CpaD/CtpE